MNNIFENAKFNDMFLTRNGLLTEGEEFEYDIVSKYKEPIDEDKLNELANEYIENIPLEDLYKEVRKDNPDGLMKLIFKAGYKKAIEE